MKQYKYEIVCDGKKTTRTNDQDKARKQIAAHQAANERSFALRDNVTGTITAYWKETHQKNYRTKTAAISNIKPLQGK